MSVVGAYCHAQRLLNSLIETPAHPLAFKTCLCCERTFGEYHEDEPQVTDYDLYTCNHCNLAMHLACAVRWYQTNPTCPACRSPIDDMKTTVLSCVNAELQTVIKRVNQLNLENMSSKVQDLGERTSKRVKEEQEQGLKTTEESNQLDEERRALKKTLDDAHNLMLRERMLKNIKALLST